ncbi:Epsin domain-containing protein [Mycena chlorophos]|uniref:Epsin domain-containing protein n=1 Tax=Mycena chlorophos TaxID=658473 RepID=A0A8H6RY44_MYCCL|nr:Epsin domain-containing protein [Mycena chlorophos]
MDRLEALGNSLSQITMYDIKSMYNQAKNVVLNVSEIEAKVREATNDDPWGASSTLMQDIANRTFNYPDFNEIMPSIYSRFMEKEARQWRQIYKSLQLLEYLIKNGSERVVDDARSHISTIKMLRNFHYIDEKGKDEGINVRNRSRELVELLSDVDKIRAERRKAKANKNKYTGTGSDGLSFSSGGGRYGGFGSESGGYGGNYSGSGGSSSDYYNSGGSGGGGGHSSGFRDERRSNTFDEYDAGGDELASPTSGGGSALGGRSPPTRRSTAPTPSAAPAPAPAPIVNLFDDDDVGAFNSAPSPAAPAPPAKSPPAAAAAVLAAPVNVFDDDDFGDFQTVGGSGTTAPPAPAPAPIQAQAAKPALVGLGFGAPVAQPAQPTMGGLGGLGGMGMGAAKPTPMMGMGMGMQAQRPMQPAMSTMQPQAPNYMSPIQAQPMRPAVTSSPAPSTPKPASGGGFDDLWTMSLGSSAPKPAANSTGSKSIKDLEKEKANAGLWGGQPQQSGVRQPTMGSGFGGASMSSGGGSSGFDDLLG